MMYDWDWSVIWEYKEAFAYGVVWTVVLWIVSITLGTILGAFWGLLLSSKHPALQPLKWMGAIFNDVVRALPPLIILLTFNFFGPLIIGIRSTFWISAFALALALAAFIADVLRGAVHGVPRPQQDAALAVGMSSAQVVRRIILPEVVRSTIPSVTLLYIDLLKATSLASVLGLPELTQIGGQVISAQFRPLEVYGAIALIYIAMVVPLSHIQRYLEGSRLFLRRS